MLAVEPQASPAYAETERESVATKGSAIPFSAEPTEQANKPAKMQPQTLDIVQGCVRMIWLQRRVRDVFKGEK
jgi:hypothetical protein